MWTGDEADRPPLDIDARWIRVTEIRSPFVLFEFTIGDPDLTVELIMPYPAFEEFRQRQKAIVDIMPEAAAPLRALAARTPAAVAI